MGQAKKLVRGATARKRWRRGPSRKQLRRAREFRECLTTTDYRELRRYTKKRKQRLSMHRAYRRVAPFQGLRGEGYWLKWLAVPAWVVRAETRGYSGEGRWRARNPSGACGPYQLLGHTSCNTSSGRDKLRHHRVAAGLPRGSWAVGY